MSEECYDCINKWEVSICKTCKHNDRVSHYEPKAEFGDGKVEKATEGKKQTNECEEEGCEEKSTCNECHYCVNHHNEKIKAGTHPTFDERRGDVKDRRKAFGG